MRFIHRRTTDHTTLHHTTPCHTKLQHTIPHHIVPHHITPHHTTPHRITPHHTTPHRITPHHTTPHHITPHHTIPYHTIDSYTYTINQCYHKPWNHGIIKKYLALMSLTVSSTMPQILKSLSTASTPRHVLLVERHHANYKMVLELVVVIIRTCTGGVHLSSN